MWNKQYFKMRNVETKEVIIILDVNRGSEGGENNQRYEYLKQSSFIFSTIMSKFPEGISRHFPQVFIHFLKLPVH